MELVNPHPRALVIGHDGSMQVVPPGIPTMLDGEDEVVKRLVRAGELVSPDEYARMQAEKRRLGGGVGEDAAGPEPEEAPKPAKKGK